VSSKENASAYLLLASFSFRHGIITPLELEKPLFLAKIGELELWPDRRKKLP
jgi:hypothetical protein